MKPPLHRFYDSTVLRFNVLRALACTLLFPLSAHPQFSPPGKISTRSLSGQFIISGAVQDGFPRVSGTNLVRLDPALLAVSAERIRESLWRDLGINPTTKWRGPIYLVLHAARSPGEDAVILSQQSGGGWQYGVQLPDAISQTRFVRAMTGVLLLEFANRNAQSHSAEVPAWLADGLAQELIADGPQDFFLSSPEKMINGLPVTRTVTIQRGMDPLAATREILKSQPVLTFAQLSWPTGAQLSGADGGAYRASAQLFASELLKLKDGPAQLRAMLQALPQFYNWQVAFQSAFREDFPRPLDLEKWWALQFVNFIARDPGPQWTPAVSRDRLDRILSVPVEMRDASNSLPVRAEISLQTLVRNMDSAQQEAILQTKLRDLDLAQLRMAAPLAGLADEYRRAIAGYLGQHDTPAPATRNVRRPSAATQKTGARDMEKKLDALDERRRTVESSIKPDFSTP